MANFNQIIDKLNQDYEATTQKGTGEAYSKLSTIFEELGSYLREYIQGITEDQIVAIIKKLKKNEQIISDDKEHIKLWLVGDAEYYTKMENNVEGWKNELKRLMGDINNFKTDNPDVVAACKLRGLFRDGSRVLTDIFYFLEQKDRVAKFDESTEEIDDSERQILIRLLEQKMKSPDF